MRREWHHVVVQCPNCSSKFRIADEKVTERGVRVRCTSCKNVFQVKKGGDLKPATEGVTGTTQEMQALDPALLAGLLAKPALSRPPAQPGAAPGAAPRKVPPQGASLPPQARPPGLSGKPPGIAARQPGPVPLPASSKPRLQADDLFGMAELTGDAAALPGSPLSSQNNLQPAARPPTGRSPGARPPGSIARPATLPPRTALQPPAQPPRPPALSADDFDVDLGGDSAGARPLAPPEPGPRAPVRPPPPTRTAPPPPRTAPPPVRPPPPQQESGRPLPPPPPVADEGPPPPPPLDDGPLHTPVKLGVFKTQLKDPFEGVDLGAGESREGADELSADKLGDRQKPKKEPAPPQPTPVEIPPPSSRRELVSSALTGLVGASMALLLVLFAAISEGDSTWNPFVNRSDIVATKVVSGLYDTASGKPVFFVRGRVENRGKKVRGPVRVVAELVTETGVESRSEALAGTEPSAEDVFGLRSAVEFDKLTRLLTRNDAERRIPPGGSLPFFAVIADPPADLQRHKLHVRLESIDAWSAPTRPAKAEADPKPAERAPSPAAPADKAAAAPAAPKAEAPAMAAPARPAEKAGDPVKAASAPADVPARAAPAPGDRAAKVARKAQGSSSGPAAAPAAAPAAPAPAPAAAPASAEAAKAADPTLP